MTEEKDTRITLTGEVTSANERGVKLDRGEKWINRSQYGTGKGLLMPAVGCRVTLVLDKAGYIQEIHPAEPAPAPSSSEPSPQAAPAPTQSSYALHDRTVCREWAVNAGIAILGGGPGHPVELDQVLGIAGELAARVLGEPDFPWPMALYQGTTGMADDREPPRKPTAPSQAARPAGQPQRAPAPASAASPGTMAAGSGTAGPSPGGPQMPQVEPLVDDDELADDGDLGALAMLRDSTGHTKEFVRDLAAHWWHLPPGARPTRRMVRILAAYLGGLVPSDAP